MPAAGTPPTAGGSGATTPALSSLSSSRATATQPGSSAALLPPLLKPRVPSDPPMTALAHLTSAPPLPYLRARAAPAPVTMSSSGAHLADGVQGAPPHHRFCEYCGYWGRVRCLMCGVRTCGLECRNVHEEVCLRGGYA